MEFIDHTATRIELSNTPRRIISLVPSQTELLYDLGLEQEVIGITRYCVHPPHWRQTKTIIGGTKKLLLDTIAALAPDLIIANKEENKKEDVEILRQKFPVWVSDVSTLEAALHMIEEIGKMTGKEKNAICIQNKIREEFSYFKIELQSLLAKVGNLSVLYLIWRKPYMIAGSDTFIHHLLSVCGFCNVAASKSRYIQVTAEEIEHYNPQIIMLSSEPYPFREKHIAELKSICPSARVLLVNGEMFSWYGSRLLYAPAYFAALWKTILQIQQ